MRWSRNAVQAKARKRMEPITQAEWTGESVVVKAARPAWRIQITRADGERVQITAHAWGRKLLHGNRLESPRQLGRRIGVLLEMGTL